MMVKTKIFFFVKGCYAGFFYKDMIRLRDNNLPILKKKVEYAINHAKILILERRETLLSEDSFSF